MENSTTQFNLFITERINGLVRVEPYYTDGLKILGKVLSADNLTPEQTKIFNLCAECEDAVLLKKFSRTSTTVMNMLRALSSNKDALDLFWKYLGQRFTQIAELLAQNPTIRVFYRKANAGVLFNHDAIDSSAGTVVPHYSFKLTPEGLTYRFRFKSGNKIMPMRPDNKITFLSQGSQCIFVLNNVLCSTNRVSQKAIMVMVDKGFIFVPAEKVKVYLQTFVSKLLQTEEMDSEGFTIDYIERKIKQASLAITTDAFGREALRLTFYYDGEEVPFYTPQKHKVELIETDGKFAFRVTKRDFAEEDRLMRLLAEHGAKPSGEFLYTKNAGATASLLAEETIKENFSLTQDFQITTDVAEKEDWFDMKMVVFIKGFMVPFAKFRSHIKHRQSTYQLPDGTVFHIPQEWFASYADLFEKAKVDGDNIHLEKRFAGLIADESPAVRHYLEELTRGDEEVPQKVNATLRSYQKVGYNYLLSLYRHQYGGCLADDMGLGKTLQFITFFTKIYEGSDNPTTAAESAAADSMNKPWKYSTATPSLFDQVLDEGESQETLATPEESSVKKVPASLVVLPTTVLFNWQKELQKFAPHLHFTVHYGPKRLNRINDKTFDPYHLVLTTYSILQRDIELLDNYAFECAVLDESHNIKNPESQVHHAAKRINANCRFVITGTPIENSLSDLWSQFSFACPGLLGTFGAFTKDYIPSSPERLDKLRKMVQPYILRRTKAEVCPDLPELIRTDIWCEMEDKERKVYDQEKSAARNILLGIEGKKNALHVLQQLTRLRQMACDPTILPEHAHLSSAKRKAVVELASELHQSGNKVLLFSSFVSQLNLLASDFKKEGITFEMLTGEDDGTMRQRKVDRFQNDKRLTCFLISLKAGSTGINLTAANYVFLLSPWWNPFAEQQAIDRAYRIGQQNNVMVYNFITRDTVEEKILHLQEKKRQLSSAVIDAENPLQSLTAEEWEELV